MALGWRLDSLTTRSAERLLDRSNRRCETSMMILLVRRRWLASALSLALAVGCGGEPAQPGHGVGGAGPGAGAGSGGSAGSAIAAGSGGLSTGGISGTTAGGQGGSVAGTSGVGGGGLGGAGASAGTAGSAGGSGTAGAGGSVAGGNAGMAGGSGDAGSAGAGGVAGGGVGGVGGANAGMSGASGASGAAAGMAGSAGSAGSTGFQPCPVSGTCIVLPFGDSITDGFGTPGGYRMELFSRARDDMHEITYVGSLQNGPTDVDGVTFPRRHEGHSAWKIDQLLGLIPSPGFNTIPHIVLLMIGTNDVINNDALGQAPARLGNLLDEIIETAPNALIVVAKITPMAQSDAQIQAYNNAIPGIVGDRVAMGKHLIVVDQYTGFPMNELADGIHPTPAGYTRMAGVWYTAIEPYLR
jgi:lysophospholipase L1-like esterase